MWTKRRRYPDDEDRVARLNMVRNQLERRGIHDERLLQAMRDVPRHAFVPAVRCSEAYGDHPLPIAEEQTISQPYMVALMIQCLRLQGGERVLEIGTRVGLSGRGTQPHGRAGLYGGMFPFAGRQRPPFHAAAGLPECPGEAG